MQQRPDLARPSEEELRIRATVRVARRRAFAMSAAVLGSLILLNLYFYSQSHRSTWLLLDAVFAGILAMRAWHTFGSERKDEQRIRDQMDRMRPSAAYRSNGNGGSSASTPDRTDGQPSNPFTA